MEASTHQRHVLMTLHGSIMRAERTSQEAFAACLNDQENTSKERQVVMRVREKLLEAAAAVEESMFPERKFPLGGIVMTQGARALVVDPQKAEELLERHAAGDWGEVDGHDRQVNEQSLKNGMRLMSSYLVDGETVWVITEADRSTTTVLRPDEY